MPSVKPWQFGEMTSRGIEPGHEFHDSTVPKLSNLTRAARAALRVPPTAWAWAETLATNGPQPFPFLLGDPFPLPCIVRCGDRLPDSPFLVVDTLEPSWAVVFPRFLAVVAELGGELSHASILLREAGIPAVVNARGAYRSIADGDLVRVDPTRGEVRIVSRGRSALPPQPTDV